jgi:hypothetical protein
MNRKILTASYRVADKKKNSSQTLGPASKRVLPDLLFFKKFFNISLSIQYD